MIRRQLNPMRRRWSMSYDSFTMCPRVFFFCCFSIRSYHEQIQRKKKRTSNRIRRTSTVGVRYPDGMESVVFCAPLTR